MIINTNVSSLTAQEAATNTNKTLSSSLEKLSTGLKINKASDDASGLAIADKLRTQATSIDQGVANGNSAVTLLQIADKSMAEQSNILDTVKAKLIQANTDTTSDDGRESIRKDIAKLLEQLDNIAEQTNYNGNILLQAASDDLGLSQELSFQVGESKNDIISNSSVQSNTVGLGSKDVYSDGTTISSNSSLDLASTGTITLEGKTSTDAGAAENITLAGDVDTLKLTAGMTISNVNDDTKAKLDAQVTAGKLSESSGTYTVLTAGIDSSLDLSAVDDVQATVAIATTGSAGTQTDITENQIITTSLTSGDLFDTLEDSTLFAKGTDGAYRALADITLDIPAGESISVSDLKNLASGSGATTFDAGDTITATAVTTGSLLDLELKDASKFTDNSDGTFTVLLDYTAGDLNIGSEESITITQGIAVSGFTADTSNLTASTITVDGNAVVRTTADATVLNVNVGDTVPYSASNGDVLKFTITGATAAEDYALEAGDILTFTDNAGTGLSEDILQSGDFLNLGSNKYQVIAGATPSVNIGVTDTITVERALIASGEPLVVSGNDATVVTGTGSADAKIELTTDTKLNVTNNSTTSGDTLSITGETGVEVNNGGTSLDELVNLSAGELTTALADSFQEVVDNAITKLNGYRGDIGSTQNQVESAVRNLMTQSTNVQAAESIIRDVDYAQESANFNKQNIISQAGSYAISQANSVQQNVLKLLQ
mgnify:FL=1